MIILKRAGRPGQQLVVFFQSNGPNWVAVSTKGKGKVQSKVREGLDTSTVHNFILAGRPAVPDAYASKRRALIRSKRLRDISELNMRLLAICISNVAACSQQDY